MSFTTATRCINTATCFECRGDFEIVFIPHVRIPVLDHVGVTVVGNRMLLVSATVKKTPFKEHLSVLVTGGTCFVLDISDIISVSDRNGGEIYT